MASSSSDPVVEETTPDTSKTPLINWLNALAFLTDVIVMNLNVVGANKISAEVPATYPTLVTPASWALYLWPVIVIIQLGWVILQIIPKYSADPLVTAVKWNYVAFCVAQIAWTLFFSYQILSMSFVAILVMLVFLFVIFRAQSSIEVTPIDYAKYKLVFSVLFGWIVLATFVDINVLLVAMEVSENVQFYVALVSLSGMLIVAGSIADLSVLFVLAWAMIGIFTELGNPNYLIATTFEAAAIKTVRAWSLASFFVILALMAYRAFTLYRSRHSMTDTKEADTADNDGSDYVSINP